MFFRRQQRNERGNYFTPWVEVVYSGNINTFIQPTLNTKQNKLTFPSEDDSDGWRLVSDDNVARRPIGDDKIEVLQILRLVQTRI